MIKGKGACWVLGGVQKNVDKWGFLVALCFYLWHYGKKMFFVAYDLSTNGAYNETKKNFWHTNLNFSRS